MLGWLYRVVAEIFLTVTQPKTKDRYIHNTIQPPEIMYEYSQERERGREGERESERGRILKLVEPMESKGLSAVPPTQLGDSFCDFFDYFGECRPNFILKVRGF